VVSVHLGYATPDFHALLDGELYLPEKTWHENPDRCRKAGIPEEVVYLPKCQIGLEQLRRARANGIRLAWMAFDEGYGANRHFCGPWTNWGRTISGEVPVSFVGWTRPPAAFCRQRAPAGSGRPSRLPRLKAKNNHPSEVRRITRYSPLFRREGWRAYRVKDGAKGPMV